MLRPRTRWLTLAAATLVVGALLPASAAVADTTTGAITGHLLDGTTPLPSVTVEVVSPNFSFAGEATTDATGAFTVGAWSGNTGDRLKANPVTIKAGKSRTHNPILSPGTIVTGRVTDPDGFPQSGRITAFNTNSRDEIGADDTTPDGTYTLHVLPGQSVALNAELVIGGFGASFFYVNSPDLEHATPVQIQKPGPIIVNIATPPQG